MRPARKAKDWTARVSSQAALKKSKSLGRGVPVTSLTREFVRQRQHIVVLNSVLGEGLRVFQGRIVLEQPLLFRHLVRDVAWRQLEILRARARPRA